MPDTVIDIANVSKRYRLGRARAGLCAPLIHAARSLRTAFDRSARPGGREVTRDGRTPDPTDPRRRPVGADVLWALRDLSFQVRRGEALGIVGRNGSGKSTLLKILSRITEPTVGRIAMTGRVAALLEVGTGFHPELTGRDNIYLNGSILGMTRAEIRGCYDQIVDFAGVERFLDTPVKRYSSGMYVRLAFAVAAHLEPEILLVDEVLAVGDLAFQQKCLGKMKSITGGGRTVLFVSHNMSAINAFCTRAIRLHNGRLVDQGDPPDVVAGYVADNFTAQRQRTFPRDPSKVMQVRSIEITPEREQPGGLLCRGGALDVHVGYDVHEPMPAAEVQLTVETADGTPVCELRDVDAGGSAGPRPVGSYVATVRIPGGMLNTGTYVLRVMIVRGGFERFDRRDGVSFDLHDPEGGIVARSGGQRRSGVLHLELPWRTRIRAAGPKTPSAVADA